MGWQEACAAKKKEQQNALPKEWLLPHPPPDNQLNVLDVPRTCGLLSSRELEITDERDVEIVLDKLRSGAWSSEEVTRAFCKRATIAHQLVNCLTIFFFDEAISRAKDLDKLRASGAPLGRLHGLPVSLKDQFCLKGKECNMGFAAWIDEISEETAELAKCLERAGAVLYCRTNVPQTLLFGETDNLVYGTTTNPINRSCTSGGSSGGEGALIALGGSVLGAGTDIGGSVRIPAALNGLYGLRPTMRRLPYAGAANTLLGMETIESSIGPLSSSLSGVKAFFQGVLEAEPWNGDAKVPYIPWREDEYLLSKIGGPSVKLAFAYYTFDGFVHVQPPMKRAILETVDALRRAGHEVIEWKPQGYRQIVLDVQHPAYSSDGGADIQAIMDKSGEPYVRDFLPQLFNPKNQIGSHEGWRLNLRRDAVRQKLLQQWMSTASQTSTGRPIDALISPATFGPAPKHFGFIYTTTTIYNTLDWPACVVPVTRVDPAKDGIDADFQAASGIDQQIHDQYIPEHFTDLPCSVQVVGRRFSEEALLKITEVVDAAVKGARFKH